MKLKILQHNNHRSLLRVSVTSLLMIVGLIFTITAGAEPRRNAKEQAKAEREFTVVIDAGHGGHDHGAVDNGSTEKTINLKVAKKFAALVRKKLKDVKVVMTRDDDTFISLQERANIANRNKGDLFISIHTNSVDKSNPNRKTVSGASVYALGPQKDANNLKVAQRENSVIELEDNYHLKYSGFDPSKDESYIIFEMAQKKNLGQSLKFADKAQKELVKTASRKDRGVKQAGFWVLWATSMPSVLVELDFICNPTQAKYLNSDSGQQKLAQALFNALDSYIDTNKKKRGSEGFAPDNYDSGQTDDAYADNSGTQQYPGGINTLVTSQQENTPEKKQHVAKANTKKNSSTSRKRRSGAARKVSDNRDVETESIALKSETEFLAIQDNSTAEENVSESSEKSKDSDKQSKKKKKKKKSKKDKKSKKTDKKKKVKESNSRSKSGKKTFVVKNSVSDKPVQSRQETVSNRNTKQPKAYSNMVYTIQLIASEKELASDDPSFCGFVPSGVFKENGYYKYIYGESKNRREIEKKLLEVKSFIPDAIIVVRNE